MVLLHDLTNKEALLVSAISLRSKHHTVVSQCRTGYWKAVTICQQEVNLGRCYQNSKRRKDTEENDC